MSSNQEIFTNFMDKVDLDNSELGFDLLIPHKSLICDSIEINIINSDTCVGLDFSNLNKKTYIKFPSFDTHNLVVRCNLCSIFPRWEKANKLDLKFDNKEKQYLCNLFLGYLIRSHISSIFEDKELESYKTLKKNSSKDIFLDEKISALEAIKAIRNKNKKKFKKNFKSWKKFVMISQEDIEDTVMDGDLYSEKKPTICFYGECSIEINEEAYRNICEVNKKIFNELTVVDMIAEKIGWW